MLWFQQRFLFGVIAFCICGMLSDRGMAFSHSGDFNTDLCANGHASTWAGACVCDYPNQFSGRYCSERPVSPCRADKSCPTGSYCLIHKNEGACFKTTSRGKLVIDHVSYVLSDALISYPNAAAFCSGLGNTYRPIQRKDFNCDGEGAACLDVRLMIKLQDVFGQRGFFWLDERPESADAYYADLNDGTVYYTQRDSFKFNQVLCVGEEQ